ncbi:hypothetical protein [Bradyrhizobium aeschynomenes]|uniref:hypothetical protein n=1 Tax=Bradyrhizobium aeschynomenes TaxID=2734909 RepID=UPI00289F5DB8|nr:hypothetical protein [Bradyrhizobium aeschynomenes]
MAITEAYFLGAKNIGDADVLAGIAADYGFERAEAHAIALDPIQHKRVEQEAGRSAAAGIRSVSHVIFGGRAAIGGSQSENEIALHVQEAAPRSFSKNRKGAY